MLITRRAHHKKVLDDSDLVMASGWLEGPDGPGEPLDIDLSEDVSKGNVWVGSMLLQCMVGLLFAGPAAGDFDADRLGMLFVGFEARV